MNLENTVKSCKICTHIEVCKHYDAELTKKYGADANTREKFDLIKGIDEFQKYLASKCGYYATNRK